ncbi:MAG: S1 RNA-binding domain-containing protein [Anaerolineae bacterium]|nr:S1 RNA-binding domain-containing protein [Anaerolineae bacterium]
MAPNENDRDEFAALLDDSTGFDTPARGDIRDAEILEIRDSEIVVDVGGKRDGIVPAQDVQRLAPKVLKSLHVGDVVPIYVLNPSDRDGNLIVSLNLGLQGQDWERARQLMESGDMLEAEITGYNRGGLLVQFGRLEGFVPTSHLVDIPPETSETERRTALNSLIGQAIGLKVIEVNQGRRRLILSQREAQREWRTQQKKRLLEDLRVGSITTGKVTGIRDFGVFVDLGGADGLIHVSELDWHRVPHPKDVVKVGEEIQVYVLELDQNNQRIALSLRRTKPDPWEIVEQTYQIDQIVEGTVSNVVDFGAFVVLQDGIEGLLHVTEMGDGTLSEPHSYLKRGDQVSVRIVRIEPERKRIGFTQRTPGSDLSIRQAEISTEQADETVGAHYEAAENNQTPESINETVDAVEAAESNELPDQTEKAIDTVDIVEPIAEPVGDDVETPTGDLAVSAEETDEEDTSDS